MLNTKGSTKILNFMTHGAGALALGRGQICHAVKMEYFFKFFLFTQGHRLDKLMLMINKEWSTKIVKIMSPWAGVLVKGHDHISHTVKMHHFFKSLLYC